jgi:molecular chaperone GrpE
MQAFNDTNDQTDAADVPPDVVEPDQVAPETRFPPTVAEVEQLQSEVTTWQDKYARLYADLDNTKKRLQRHYAYQAEQEKVQLLRDLLPVKDNLERALRHALGGAAEQSLRLGVELTLKLFDNTLAQYGVTPIEAWDHPFDPDLHEAVGLVEQPNLPPGTVAHVEQMGYTIDGSVLRPAKVLVTPG